MSDWNESSRIRKDFRHSHDGPEVPRGANAVSADKKRKKKHLNRRWCGGKVGVEHTVVLVDQQWHKTTAVCSKCGMGEYSLPVEDLAQVYERARNYIEYRELCKEYGHTWEEVELDWWRYRKIKYCAICNDSPQLFSWAPLDNL